MQKLLLLSLSLLGMSAMSPSNVCAQERVNPKSLDGVASVRKAVTTKESRIVKARPFAVPQTMLKTGDNRKVKILKDASGISYKTIGRIKNNALASMMAGRKAASHKAGEAATFSESFEGYDETDKNWLPEGWTKQVKGEETWGFSGAIEALGYYPYDGKYMAAINFSDKDQDEWLITPDITVSQGQVLTAHVQFSPAFLFDMNYVDWDKYEFTEKHIAATLKIMVKPEDGEWEQLKDIADDYWDMTLDEMLAAETTAFTEFTLSLDKYVGKKVKVGFEYVGKDGNTMFLDAVSVDYPKLSASYSNPVGTLYWGYDQNFVYLSDGVAMEPVFQPLTWTNTTGNDAASYSWYYMDATTNDMATYQGTDLTQTYKPDYSSEVTTRNNWFYTPELTASAEGAADGKYKAADKYFQAGGHAGYEEEGKSYTFGLNTCSVLDGLTIMTADSEDPSKAAIPIFGHNEETAKWWENYTKNGDDEVNLTAEVDAIINFYYATSPTVVDGLCVLAKGQIGENAEFKAEIIPLTDEFVPVDQPLATATCKASDVKVYESGVQSNLALPFKFDTPVAINGKDFTAYIVRVSGFNSPDVTYFAPYQSAKADPDELCYGFLDVKRTFEGSEPESSMVAIANFETADGPCYNSFYMNLDAHLPWLQSDKDEVSFGAEGGSADVALDSYYDASTFTLTAVSADGSPATWLQTSASGRYGSTVLSLTADKTTTERECTVTVAAPGVSKTFSVKQSPESGITAVGNSASSPVVGYYSVSGQNINAHNLPKGQVYLVKHADGRVVKTVK